MTMIEKVARAIEGVNQDTVGLKYTDLTRAMARAAIEAMKEPTVAMLEEARWEDGIGTARAVWDLMIDEALKEEGK